MCFLICYSKTIINWVIVGGESGPKARPMKADWAINIKEQCDSMKIPFCFKQ
jgi:protein gp37